MTRFFLCVPRVGLLRAPTRTGALHTGYCARSYPTHALLVLPHKPKAKSSDSAFALVGEVGLEPTSLLGTTF